MSDTQEQIVTIRNDVIDQGAAAMSAAAKSQLPEGARIVKVLSTPQPLELVDSTNYLVRYTLPVPKKPEDDVVSRADYLALQTVVGVEHAMRLAVLKLAYMDNAHLDIAKFMLPKGYKIVDA